MVDETGNLFCMQKFNKNAPSFPRSLAAQRLTGGCDFCLLLLQPRNTFWDEVFSLSLTHTHTHTHTHTEACKTESLCCTAEIKATL